MAKRSCSIKTPDISGVEKVQISPEEEIADYRHAVVLANAEAAARFDEYMLISWYDRDRDFESPQHSSEGPEGSPKNGYIHYAVTHGARLKVDVDGGRFVFFYTPVDWQE